MVRFHTDGAVGCSVILGTVPGHPTTPNLALERRPDCAACSYTAKSRWPLSWANPSDVEFVYPVGMSEPRCTVESVQVLNASANTTRIVMKQPCMWNLINRDWQPVGTIPPTWLENIRSELTTPGQWYHDRQHQKILYYPLPGQDMATARAVLAVEETLVRHEGARNHVWKNLRCAFLTFAAATALPFRSLPS